MTCYAGLDCSGYPKAYFKKLNLKKLNKNGFENR